MASPRGYNKNINRKGKKLPKYLEKTKIDEILYCHITSKIPDRKF